MSHHDVQERALYSAAMEDGLNPDHAAHRFLRSRVPPHADEVESQLVTTDLLECIARYQCHHV
jgi:hypothetical protein